MPHDRKNKYTKRRRTAAYETFPLAQAKKINPADNTTIPPIQGVQDAKDWVDYNKK